MTSNLSPKQLQVRDDLRFKIINIISDVQEAEAKNEYKLTEMDIVNVLSTIISARSSRSK